MVVVELEEVVDALLLSGVANLGGDPPVQTGGAGVGALGAVRVHIGAVAVRNREQVVVDALVGGGLILPRSDDHHCGLAGFEGFTSSGLIHAGHGVAAFVEVTHLLEEGLVLLGVDGDLAIGGVDAGAIALQERSPAEIRQSDAVLGAIGLGELLGNFEQLIPSLRVVGVGQAGSLPHVGVIPHSGRCVTHRDAALLFGTVDIEGDLVNDVLDVLIGAAVLVVVEIGDALEGAVDGPALAVVGAGGHEVRAVAGGDLGHHGLADGAPRLQLSIDLILILGLVEVFDDGLEGLAISLREAVPHRDLDLAVSGRLGVVAAAAAGGQADGGHHSQGRRSRESLGALLDPHGFLLFLLVSQDISSNRCSDIHQQPCLRCRSRFVSCTAVCNVVILIIQLFLSLYKSGNTPMEKLFLYNLQLFIFVGIATFLTIT